MEEDIVFLQELIDFAILPNTTCFIEEKEIKAIRNLIKRNKELEEAIDNFMKGKAYSTTQIEKIENNYIPKSKVVEVTNKIMKKTEKLFNTTILPINKKIFNDNMEKYEPVLIGREIAQETVRKLLELLEEGGE